MKRVLIVGKDSYIGNHIQKRFVDAMGDDVSVHQLDTLTDEWKTFDYEGFDAIVHVAGIVHRPDVSEWSLYERVNVDLPMQIAQKAKSAGVGQFIFFSTMAVYGVEKELRRNVIDKDTPTNPQSMYGRSKYMAEQQLKDLETLSFKVVVVRPPNVYGKNCRGGYIPGFISVVDRLPVIPKAYQNVKQSMIYVENLAEFVRLSVVNGLSGTFMPQDDKVVSSVELIRAIAEARGKKMRTSAILGLFVRLFSFVPIIKKAYGGVEYDENLSKVEGVSYVIIPFDKGIASTVS